eukprot:3237050-Amphidinium_carterae.4
MAKVIVNGVTDVGVVKTRPEMAWNHLLNDDSEFEELLEVADTFHARGELFPNTTNEEESNEVEVLNDEFEENKM